VSVVAVEVVVEVMLVMVVVVLVVLVLIVLPRQGYGSTLRRVRGAPVTS
jgi:hypothetical protein